MLYKNIIGITPAADKPDYSLMRDAGIEWLRVGLGFPFKNGLDKGFSESFLRNLGEAERLHNMGFKLMSSTTGPGSFRYEANTKQTIWKSGMPVWAGDHSSEIYYEVLKAACTEESRKASGIIDIWQVANEPDVDMFRGPLSDSQIVRFLLAGARGVKKGNSEAMIGINLGGISEYSRGLLKETYCIQDTPFDYIGLDGYYGSWGPGGPESWKEYIDEAYTITDKPIIINEWGYSTLQNSPKTDDPENKKYYNQDVCKNKSWGRAWKKEHSPYEQAEFISECMKIFAKNPNVLGQFFFRWSDTKTCWQCGQPDCPAECAWGIVDVDGNPKPGYYALKDSIKELYGNV